MDIYEIVKKLTGDIEPIGDSNVDRKRLKNLQVVTELVDKLIFDINFVVRHKDRVEWSMKTAGEFAVNFLAELKDSLD